MIYDVKKIFREFEKFSFRVQLLTDGSLCSDYVDFKTGSEIFRSCDYFVYRVLGSLHFTFDIDEQFSQLTEYHTFLIKELVELYETVVNSLSCFVEGSRDDSDFKFVKTNLFCDFQIIFTVLEIELKDKCCGGSAAEQPS